MIDLIARSSKMTYKPYFFKTIFHNQNPLQKWMDMIDPPHQCLCACVLWICVVCAWCCICVCLCVYCILYHKWQCKLVKTHTLCGKLHILYFLRNELNICVLVICVCVKAISSWLSKKYHEGKIGHVIFLILYLILNMFIFWWFRRSMYVFVFIHSLIWFWFATHTYISFVWWTLFWSLCVWWIFQLSSFTPTQVSSSLLIYVSSHKQHAHTQYVCFINICIQSLCSLFKMLFRGVPYLKDRLRLRAFTHKSVCHWGLVLKSCKRGQQTILYWRVKAFSM